MDNQDKKDKVITMRVTAEEWQILEEYCKKKKRFKNEVIREFIRNLKESK